MNEEIRKGAKELVELGNIIEDKVRRVSELESEIEKLQVYRNERGIILLHGILDAPNNKAAEISE